MADTINLAEFGTYSLEFTRLSQILGDPKYAAYANSVVDRALMEPTAIPGLFPTTWDAHTFQPVNSSKYPMPATIPFAASLSNDVLLNQV